MADAPSTTEPQASGGFLRKLVVVVIVIAVVYLGGFVAWRTQLTSFDDVAVDMGSGDGLPDWLDGGNDVLIIDSDSVIDEAGAVVFAPLVALEESVREVNYISTDSWKVWED